MAGLTTWLGTWGWGASTAYTGPESLAGPVPSGLVVRTYDAATLAPVDEWINPTGCEIAFGVHGPEQATVTLPLRTATGALNPALSYRRLMPGNQGVLVEIDARGLGIEDVWLGQALRIPRGSQKAALEVACEGPHSWLGRETVPARVAFDGSAGAVFAELIASHPNPLRLRLGDVDRGGPVKVSLTGASLWEAITSLEEMTLGRAHFTALPGGARLVADWRDQLAERDDGRGLVVLEEGVNCEWEADADLTPPFEAMLVAGRSFGDATIDGVMMARAPGGPVLGRLAALTAAVTSPVASALAGQGGAQIRPDLGALPSLYSQAEAAVRAQLCPPQVANVHVTDLTPAFVRRLRVGKLVETRFRSDATGLFTRAVAQVQQMTIDCADSKSLPRQVRSVDLGVELWAVME